jgi:hypothetical protein
MNIYSWLNHNACEDDVIDGAIFVGDAAGTNGTDWNVYDENAVRACIAAL